MVITFRFGFIIIFIILQKKWTNFYAKLWVFLDYFSWTETLVIVMKFFIVSNIAFVSLNFYCNVKSLDVRVNKYRIRENTYLVFKSIKLFL